MQVFKLPVEISLQRLPKSAHVRQVQPEERGVNRETHGNHFVRALFREVGRKRDEWNDFGEANKIATGNAKELFACIDTF
jgi:hypothetical protein